MNIICQAVAYAEIYQCDTYQDFAMEQKFTEHMATYGLSYGTKEEYAFRLDQYARTDAKL